MPTSIPPKLFIPCEGKMRSGAATVEEVTGKVKARNTPPERVALPALREAGPILAVTALQLHLVISC